MFQAFFISLMIPTSLVLLSFTFFKKKVREQSQKSNYSDIEMTACLTTRKPSRKIKE
jgi:hypothetical protein